MLLETQKLCAEKWRATGDAGEQDHSTVGYPGASVQWPCSPLPSPPQPGKHPPCPGLVQVLGIANVDTRAITRRLRVTGCLNGVITTGANTSTLGLLVGT